VEHVADDSARCKLKSSGEPGWEWKATDCSEGLPKTEHFVMYYTSREHGQNFTDAVGEARELKVANFRTGQNLDMSIGEWMQLERAGRFSSPCAGDTAGERLLRRCPLLQKGPICLCRRVPRWCRCFCWQSRQGCLAFAMPRQFTSARAERE